MLKMFDTTTNHKYPTTRKWVIIARGSTILRETFSYSFPEQIVEAAVFTVPICGISMAGPEAVCFCFMDNQSEADMGLPKGYQMISGPRCYSMWTG